jgi:hypothetical protein
MFKKAPLTTKLSPRCFNGVVFSEEYAVGTPPVKPDPSPVSPRITTKLQKSGIAAEQRPKVIRINDAVLSTVTFPTSSPRPHYYNTAKDLAEEDDSC